MSLDVLLAGEMFKKWNVLLAGEKLKEQKWNVLLAGEMLFFFFFEIVLLTGEILTKLKC